jgi:hypothetical protein
LSMDEYGAPSGQIQLLIGSQKPQVLGGGGGGGSPLHEKIANKTAKQSNCFINISFFRVLRRSIVAEAPMGTGTAQMGRAIRLQRG